MIMKKIFNLVGACKNDDHKGTLFYIKCKYAHIINLS